MNADSFQSLRMAAERAARRVMLLLGRGRVQLTRDDKSVQELQVVLSAKETMDLVRLGEFGFASRIPKDGDVAVIFLNAERSYGIVVASGHQKFRFKLENDGETAIHDAFGKSIWLKKEGGIVVDANDQPVEINRAKKVTVNAGDDGFELTTTGDGTIDMGGKDLTISNAGTVLLDSPEHVHLDGAGGRKVVCDGDPVSGGVVHAAAGQKVTAGP